MTQQKTHSIGAARYQIIVLCIIAGIFLSSCGFLKFGSAPQVFPQTKMVTRFNFHMLTGGVVIVRASVGEKADSLNFVLDTGSGGISLDSTTVHYLNLPAVDSDRTIRGIAGIRKVQFVRNIPLNLPGLKVEHLDFHINDYAILTSVYGIRIDGIIGYSFLSRYIVKINYDNYTIEVYEPGETTYPKNGFLFTPPQSSIPIFPATIIDGTKVAASFYFDTGAGLSLLLSDRFAKDSSIFKKGKKMTLTQAEGIGGKKGMYLSTVKQVRFGKYRFKKVPTHIFEDEYNVTAYPVLGGLMGNEIFRRFNLIINYGSRKIHMMPNTHYNDAFDYSYTGMSIYYVNGDILIEDIMEGSPAADAGLKPGDIIMAISNNFSNNIQAYKNLMQNPGSKLKIIIVRDSKPIEVVLKVKSIL